MSAAKRFFLDTNILVYTFDQSAPEKRRRALGLLEEALSTQRGSISWQVVQEFLNLATRRFKVPLTPEDARLYLDRVLLPLCEVLPSAALYREGLRLAERYQLAFYDALIVAAALNAGAKILYSEDLQHGQVIEGVTIHDPF